MTLSTRPFQAAGEAALIALWETAGLIQPWNDPQVDIARKRQVQPELFLVAELDGALVGSVIPAAQKGNATLARPVEIAHPRLIANTMAARSIPIRAAGARACAPPSRVCSVNIVQLARMRSERRMPLLERSRCELDARESGEPRPARGLAWFLGLTAAHSAPVHVGKFL
jgi:hypothetical protein